VEPGDGSPVDTDGLIGEYLMEMRRSIWMVLGVGILWLYRSLKSAGVRRGNSSSWVKRQIVMTD